MQWETVVKYKRHLSLFLFRSHIDFSNVFDKPNEHTSNMCEYSAMMRDLSLDPLTNGKKL